MIIVWWWTNRSRIPPHRACSRRWPMSGRSRANSSSNPSFSRSPRHSTYMPESEVPHAPPDDGGDPHTVPAARGCGPAKRTNQGSTRRRAAASRISGQHDGHGALFQNDQQFPALAQQVAADLRANLSKYDIRDHAHAGELLHNLLQPRARAIRLQNGARLSGQQSGTTGAAVRWTAALFD